MSVQEGRKYIALKVKCCRKIAYNIDDCDLGETKKAKREREHAIIKFIFKV